jgi:hypothetical protein
MGKRLLVVLFCILVVASAVSAQKHRWAKVANPGERYTAEEWYFDYGSVQRLPDGRARGWSKRAGDLRQIEVDCVAERFRVLKEIKLGNSSGYGQPTADMDVTDVAEVDTWRVSKFGSYDYQMSIRVCIGAKDLPIQTTNSTTKKKVVRKVVRRKP